MMGPEVAGCLGKGPKPGKTLRNSRAAVGFASQFWDLFVRRSWGVITVNGNKIEADPGDGGIENDVTKGARIVSGLCKLAFV